MKRFFWMFAFICLAGGSTLMAGSPQGNQPLRADAAPPVTSELGVIKRNLAALIDTGRLVDLRWRNFSEYRSQLRDFYQPSDFALAWMAGNSPRHRRAP